MVSAARILEAISLWRTGLKAPSNLIGNVILILQYYCLSLALAPVVRKSRGLLIRLYSYEGTPLASPSWMDGARAIGTHLVSSCDEVGDLLCECGCPDVQYARCPCHAVVSISVPKP